MAANKTSAPRGRKGPGSEENDPGKMSWSRTAPWGVPSLTNGSRPTGPSRAAIQSRPPMALTWDGSLLPGPG